MIYNFLTIFIFTCCYSRCTKPEIRKEWRQLSEIERQKYLSSVKELKNRPQGEWSHPQSWNYDQFSEIHYKYSENNHSRKNNPMYSFLPWHRVFIQYFEDALKTIDNSVTLTYWDWTLDSQDPQTALVFKYFGLNGNNVTNCIDSGLAAGWMRNIPEKHCLKRCNDFSSFWTPEGVAMMINKSKSFKTFHSRLEDGPHAQIHRQVGGDCGDFTNMYSSNDPLFYLHHAMVDKIWWRWQNRCSVNKYLYAGNSEKSFEPFPFVFEQVIDSMKGNFCYIYSKNNGDLDLDQDCSEAGFENDWLQTWILNLLPAKGVKLTPAVDQGWYSLGVDENDSFAIRIPKRLSDEYIQNIEKNPEIIRANEAFLEQVIRSFNNITNYLSPASLKNAKINFLWSE
jgi:tyrosinase